MMPLGGRMNGTERYGLDLIRLDLDAEPLLDDEGLASFVGDPATNVSCLAFGMPVHGSAVTRVLEQEQEMHG